MLPPPPPPNVVEPVKTFPPPPLDGPGYLHLSTKLGYPAKVTLAQNRTSEKNRNGGRMRRVALSKRFLVSSKVSERTHHVRVVELVLGGNTVRGVTIARAAASHNHVIHGVVILLLYLGTIVQQIVTCNIQE